MCPLILNHTQCSEAFYRWNAPWRVRLRGGQIVRGFGTNWPFGPTQSVMPANARIRRIGPSGEGEIIVDNVAGIEAELQAYNERVSTRVRELNAAARDTTSPPVVGGRVDAEGGGCGGGAMMTGWWALVGLLVGRRVTRRRRVVAAAS